MQDQKHLAQALSHVLWIGGSPCAGKSTIGHTIARTHVFLDYHLDPMARNHAARRLAKGDAASNESSDPERRLRNLIDRDCQLTHYVKQQAEELHLSVYEVDGSRSVDEMTALVEKHFEPYLVKRLSQMNGL